MMSLTSVVCVHFCVFDLVVLIKVLPMQVLDYAYLAVGCVMYGSDQGLVDAELYCHKADIAGAVQAHSFVEPLKLDPSKTTSEFLFPLGQGHFPDAVACIEHVVVLVYILFGLHPGLYQIEGVIEY